MTSVLGAELPAHWSVAPLKHVTDTLNRGSAPNYADSGPVRAISQASNQVGGLDWERTRFHDFDGVPSTLKGYLRHDDVLVNSTGTGTLGRVGYFTGSPDGLPCMADSHVTIARAKVDEFYPRFAYYWLGSQPFQAYVYAALVVGATNQIELNRDRLGDAPVPLPPLEEQRRIADFLDVETARVDRLTSLRRRQLEVTGEGLATQAALLTGRLRLREPGASCERVQLRRALEFVQTGSTPENLRHGEGEGAAEGRLPWYTPAALDGWLATAPAEKTAKTETGVPIFPSGAILITGIGESLGKVGYLNHTATGNQQLTSLVPRREVNGRFIAWQLWSAEAEIRAWAQYSRIRIINNDSLKSFPIYLPSRDEQDWVVATLDLHLRKMYKVQESICSFERLAAERRQSLITAAVTGKFDVSTASGRNATEGPSA